MKQIQNYMEDVVKKEMELLLPTMQVCRCDDCKLDMLALALNRLPPYYVVSEKGAIFARVDELDVQSHTNVIKAITDAAAVVGTHPRHGNQP